MHDLVYNFTRKPDVNIKLALNAIVADERSQTATKRNAHNLFRHEAFECETRTHGIEYTRNGHRTGGVDVNC